MKTRTSALRTATLPIALIIALGLALGSQLLALNTAVSAPPGPGGKPGPLVQPTNTRVVVVRTATPRPQIASVPEQAPDTCGPITDFEQLGNWRRGDEPYGTFTQSSETARSGSYSARIAYTFPTAGNDYVVFLRSVPIGGTPRALTAWVYGDGAGHYLNFWVRDAAGEVWSFTFGQVKHQGWQQMVGTLDTTQPWPTGHVSGPGNGVVEYPISLDAIVLDDAPDTYAGSGNIYIDDLACSEAPLVPVSPPGPQDSSASRIAFSWVGEAGSPDLYTIQPDGGNLARLSATTGFEGSPSWSPNGNQILFQCCPDVTCATDLCVMNADGTGRRTLLQGVFSAPGQEVRPAWSPDGSRIAFTGQNPHFPSETSVFIAGADGSNPVWLTGGRNPDWSPDGTRIAVSDEANGVREIMVTRVDGTELRQLTDNRAGNADFPTWSPDGAWLAYCLRGKSLGEDGVRIVSTGGGGDRRVAPGCDWGLDWSPDGRELVVSQFDNLMLVRADSGSASTLTKGRDPSWSGGRLLTVPIPQQPFGPIVFSTGFDQQAELPVGQGTSFPLGVTDLYASWRYSGVQPGDRFSFEWFVNDSFWFRGEDAFQKASGQAWQWIYQPDRAPLPAGKYKIVVSLAGQQILSGEVVVQAAGQAPPIPQPPVPAGGACAVRLIEPGDRATFGPGTDNVPLRWELSRPLAAGEYFFVNVPFPHGGSTWYDGTWRDPSQQLPSGTRDTQWVLRNYLCLPGFSDTGWYDWYVEVRHQTGGEPSQNDPVQCRSETRSFNWSGCEPTPTPTDEPEGPYD